MERMQSRLFRRMMEVLEPYFASGRVELLHCNYGYLVFTSDKLHKRFKGKGNAQWQDIDDLFYFTISFDAEDKDTLKEKGVEIELWCYQSTEIRNAWKEIYEGEAGMGRIYSKKGFDLVYRQEIVPLRVPAGEETHYLAKLTADLTSFLEDELPEIETVLLLG